MYYRNRMYHPDLGRFVSRDSVRFMFGENNLYDYVDASPFQYSDPMGQEKWREEQGFCRNKVEHDLKETNIAGVDKQGEAAISTVVNTMGFPAGGTVSRTIVPCPADMFRFPGIPVTKPKKTTRGVVKKTVYLFWQSEGDPARLTVSIHTTQQEAIDAKNRAKHPVRGPVAVNVTITQECLTWEVEGFCCPKPKLPIP